MDPRYIVVEEVDGTAQPVPVQPALPDRLAAIQAAEALDEQHNPRPALPPDRASRPQRWPMTHF